MNDITCDACEPDHETKDLIRSIQHTITILDKTNNMYTDWMSPFTAPEVLDNFRHKIEQINLPCRDILSRAIELLETTSTNFVMADAVDREVRNIIGLMPFNNYRACDVNFCSCKMRVLYSMIGTPDVLRPGQIAEEDKAHKIHHAIASNNKALNQAKHAHADALRNLANFRWNIHAPHEEELALIESLSSSALKVKDDIANLVQANESLKQEFGQQQNVLYDMFCV